VPDLETTKWLNISNCGVVVIRKGDISLKELEQELSNIFYRDWPWQIRELTPCRFLTRFPPHRKVSNIKNLSSFSLRRRGYKLRWWNG
jgi:hypothetical protein